MARRLIVFAHPLEAKVTLERFGPSDTLITGMGMEAVEATLPDYLPHYDELLNIGLCGALSTDLQFHGLYEVATVSLKGETALTLGPEGLRLLSVAAPLHDTEERDALAVHHDLVDMEGYAVARLALESGKRVRLLKLVSDYASSKTSALIQEHKERLSTLIADAVSRQMSAVRP